MKYLFFDIECSNCFGGVGKMCEFGYVLMDEEFRIIKHGDIPMSPGKGRENKFHLTGRKNERDLVLAYDEKFYFAQDEFPAFYERIKSLMEDVDTICFAYSMDNDIAHLYNTCKRYGLEQINYECYDVQKLVSNYLDRKGQISLHEACKTIVGPNSMVRLHEHLSRDDAEMEKMIFEGICILTKKKANELLEESGYAKANSIEFMNRVKERKERRNKRKSAGHALYDSLAISDEDAAKDEYIGRRFIISRDLKNDLAALKVAIEFIKQKNGVFVHPVSKSDFFIVYDEKNKEEILAKLSHPYDGVVVLKDDLWALRETPIKK